jgi:hypothetical protein
MPMGDWLTDRVFNEVVFSYYVIGGKEGRYNEYWLKRCVDQVCKSDRPV